MTKADLIKENRFLKKMIQKKDAEISELIHMHREIDKRMDSIFKEAVQQKKEMKWWERLFS